MRTLNSRETWIEGMKPWGGGGQVCSLEKDHKGGKLDFQAFDVAMLQHQTQDDHD